MSFRGTKTASIAVSCAVALAAAFVAITFGTWSEDESATAGPAAGDLETDRTFATFFDSPTTLTPVETTAPPQFKTFEPNEFRDLFDTADLPFLTPNPELPEITGDSATDEYLRVLAESRGYKFRTVPTEGLGSIDGYAIQPDVRLAWSRLSAGAKEAGVELILASGLRTPEQQRELFIEKLETITTDFSSIPTGVYDEAILEVLDTMSIPGYSKHHTGYAIDMITPGGSFDDFDGSEAELWLSADNYLNAKRYGFIPSYPDGADNQGPLPEAWEYVWVGIDQLIT